MPPSASATTIDITRRFRPTKSQERFLRSKARGRLFSSGYGSGKSKTGCREGIRWALGYAGSRGLIGRLTFTDLRDTTMVTFWKEMATIGLKGGSPEQVAVGKAHYSHNKADKEVVFWNGSTIIYRHLDDPDALGSLELNWAFLDEGAEIADGIYKTLSSSRLRWHLPACDQQEKVLAMIEADASDEQIAAVDCDCPRGIWVCTNPGASGYLRAVTRGEVPDWEWIRATPGDNPYNGPDYYAKMDRDAKINGPVWVKKFKNGDWDAFEGQRFPMLDRDTHILAEPFRPGLEHQIIEGWDFGHRETFVVWLAFKWSLDEPVVVFDELQVREVQEPRQVADKVKQIRAGYGLRNVIALGDPAGVAANQFSAVSPIQAYGMLNIQIAPCKQGKSPTARADLLTKFLNQRIPQVDGSRWPGIMFGPNCPSVYESCVNLRWKEVTNRLGEDPREQFVKRDDHGYDALTYGLVGVPPPGTPPPEKKPMSGVNISARDVVRDIARAPDDGWVTV